MTRLALLVLALAVTLATPAQAQAGIVSPEDAAELAQTLAEAQEEQDVCYGWNVTNNFSSSNDVGSSTGGPGVPLVPLQATCPKGAVILEGDIDYSCDSCESSDSASVAIASSLRNPPTVGDLKGLGLKAGDLTGDKDDTTLVNMVNALPLLVADRGNAPYVEYEQAKTVPPADHATDKPGSDLLRDSWLGLLFFGAMILAGPGLFFYVRAQSGRPSKRGAPGIVAPRPGLQPMPPPPSPAEPGSSEPWSAEPASSEPASSEPASSAPAPAEPSPPPPRAPRLPPEPEHPDPFEEIHPSSKPPPPPPAT